MVFLHSFASLLALVICLDLPSVKDRFVLSDVILFYQLTNVLLNVDPLT